MDKYVTLPDGTAWQVARRYDSATGTLSDLALVPADMKLGQTTEASA